MGSKLEENRRVFAVRSASTSLALGSGLRLPDRFFYKIHTLNNTILTIINIVKAIKISTHTHIYIYILIYFGSSCELRSESSTEHRSTEQVSSSSFDARKVYRERDELKLVTTGPGAPTAGVGLACAAFASFFCELRKDIIDICLTPVLTEMSH